MLHKDLAANSLEAMICSYECTFCITCVNEVLNNVCPNCGGGFSHRPIRPKLDRRSGVSLKHQPASSDRVITNYSKTELIRFSEKSKDLPPEER